MYIGSRSLPWTLLKWRCKLRACWASTSQLCWWLAHFFARTFSYTLTKYNSAPLQGLRRPCWMVCRDQRACVEEFQSSLHIHIQAKLHTHTHTRACTHAHMHVHTHAHACMHTHACTHKHKMIWKIKKHAYISKKHTFVWTEECVKPNVKTNIFF